MSRMNTFRQLMKQGHESIKGIYVVGWFTLSPISSFLPALPCEMERLEKESSYVLIVCCSTDCRHALRSESRPGPWEHGSSESPVEDRGVVTELSP